MCSGTAGCFECKRASKNSKKWGRRELQGLSITNSSNRQFFAFSSSHPPLCADIHPPSVQKKTPVPLRYRWQTTISSDTHGPHLHPQKSLCLEDKLFSHPTYGSSGKHFPFSLKKKRNCSRRVPIVLQTAMCNVHCLEWMQPSCNYFAKDGRVEKQRIPGPMKGAWAPGSINSKIAPVQSSCYVRQ